jgi:hypothetical protein
MPVNEKQEKKSIWAEHMSIIKDVIFIIMFLASAIGWIRAEVKNKNEEKTQIEILTDRVNDLATHVKEKNELMQQQQILNGKIIQYMETKK